MIKYKSFSFNKNYSNKIDEELKKRFNNTSEFSNSNINKFILLLRNGINPCEYIDEKENFNETSLTEKEEFYNNLNMENITDSDYMHVKRVCKDFEIKKLGEYHDLCLLENVRKMCFRIYHLDPVKFLSHLGLGQTALKRTDVKLKKLTDIDMVSMVEKSIRRGIRHAVQKYAKVNNKYMKDYDKMKNCCILNIEM